MDDDHFTGTHVSQKRDRSCGMILNMRPWVSERNLEGAIGLGVSMLFIGAYRIAFAGICVVLFTAFSLPQIAIGQESDVLHAKNPLHLADTASPRATLRSFLLLSEELIEAWQGARKTLTRSM
ncbi:MAG: hypothetical protein P8Q36_03495 [Alphaproteobacteria bacterium]|nr:hypothetical protein [Rhodospirillaceae bacterium]MBT7612038.1 hypothetical protein [Rhodospirillaceae bacterium]MBT7646156.1 hypothetical protein [Rhodospirillaceae bacterium]MDG2479923.1 hypothetical protein [Alphaproteobacteria bacterium]